MTIQMIGNETVNVAGSHVAAPAILTLTPELEADLVAREKANYVVEPDAPDLELRMEDFGYSPAKTSAENWYAMKKATDMARARGGALITCWRPGTYNLGGPAPISIWDDTHYLQARGVRTRQGNGFNQTMFVNGDWQSTNKVNITSINDAAYSPIWGGRRLATVTTASAHGLLPGKYALIKWDQTEAYNGVKRVFAVPTPTTLVIEMSDKNAIGAASSFSLATLTGTTTNASPVITFVSSNPIDAGCFVGMAISGTNIPAGATITDLNGTTITISANCTGAGTAIALTITYAMTLQSADANIWLSGGVIDFNGANNLAAAGYLANAITFNKAGRCGVRDIEIIGAVKYCVYACNTDQFEARDVFFDSASDGLHFNGWTLRPTARNLTGSAADDFFAWTSNNTGYTQQDVPNGDMADGGPFIGGSLTRIVPTRTSNHTIALYPFAAHPVQAEIFDVDCSHGRADKLLIVDASSTGSVGPRNPKSYVRIHVTRGKPTSNFIKLGGQVQNPHQGMIGLLHIDGLPHGVTVDYSTHAVLLDNFYVNKIVVDSKAEITFDIAAARYLVYAGDAYSGWGNLVINEHTSRTSGSGNSHNVVAAATGAQCGRTRFKGVQLFGTAALMTGGPVGDLLTNEQVTAANINATTDVITLANNIPTGRAVMMFETGGAPGGLASGTVYYAINQSATTIKLATSYALALAGTAIDITSTGTGPHVFKSFERPVIELDDANNDAYSLLRVNFACKLRVNNARTRAPGGTPPILLYGGAALIDLWVNNLDAGNATNWLQLGTAAGDALTVNLHVANVSADPGVDPGVSFVSTSGTFNLRRSDPSWIVDAAKFAAISPGAVFRNNNAAYGVPGVGVYVQGPTAASRVAS